MIFIEAQGPRRTPMEKIFGILAYINFDEVKRVKPRNVHEKLQVLFKYKTKPVCFVNFMDGNARKKFTDMVELQFLKTVEEQE